MVQLSPSLSFVLIFSEGWLSDFIKMYIYYSRNTWHLFSCLSTVMLLFVKDGVLKNKSFHWGLLVFLVKALRVRVVSRADEEHHNNNNNKNKSGTYNYFSQNDGMTSEKNVT